MYSYSFQDGVWRITVSVDSDRAIFVEKERIDDTEEAYSVHVPAERADAVIDFLIGANAKVRYNKERTE